MKLSGMLIWIVVFVVFSLIKNSAKKADKNRTVNSQPDNQGGDRDPLQNFFHQLNGGENRARSTKQDNVSHANVSSQKVKSVEDFFKVTNTDPKKNIQPKRRVRVVNPRVVTQKEVEHFVPKPNAVEEAKPYGMEDDLTAQKASDKFDSEVNKVYTVGKENAIEDFGQKKSMKMIDLKLDEKHLKHAVVWAEILKKPRALKQWH